MAKFVLYVQNMHHHYRSLGGWTFAFSDYLDLNITAYVDDPNMQKLAAIIDPYCKFVTCITQKSCLHYIMVSPLLPAYLERLTMPKLLINTGGDEFFLPDDNHYFWNDLPDDKYVR